MKSFVDDEDFGSSSNSTHSIEKVSLADDIEVG